MRHGKKSQSANPCLCILTISTGFSLLAALLSLHTNAFVLLALRLLATLLARPPVAAVKLGRVPAPLAALRRSRCPYEAKLGW